jgi:NAD(P)-dependent dehydrogenase (short-subunit alcohol dehydrogenase family)
VILERSCSSVQAYCQSKLAQIMMTFDLAGGGDGDPSVVATTLHPSTYMPVARADSYAVPAAPRTARAAL